MRAAGLSVYCFALLPSFNKVDTYIHQSKKCAKLTQVVMGNKVTINVNNELLAIDY